MTAPQQAFSTNSPIALGGMKPFRYVIWRLLVVASLATGAWQEQEYARRHAPEAALIACAHQPMRFESKQYFNCPVRRT